MSAAGRLGGRVGSRAGRAWCLALARTTDGGQTWTAAPAPPATVASAATGPSAVSVRFADPMDGWIYAVNPTRLWSTHDGGRQSGSRSSRRACRRPRPSRPWRPRAATSGWRCSPRTSSTVHLERSPVEQDAWTDVDTGVPIGAGPVPATQLVLHGTYGWLLENDRTVVGGARLDGAGQWLPWTPPCATANGTASLAASSATDLVAVCAGGEWGPARNLPAGPRPRPPGCSRSSDGGCQLPGRRARPRPALNAGRRGLAGASDHRRGQPQPAGPAATGVLSASFNGGRTWQTVLQVPAVRALERPGVHHAHPGCGDRLHPVRVHLLP